MENKKINILRIIFVVVLFAFSVSPLYATEITVNTLNNDLVVDPLKCKLNQAIEASNTNAPVANCAPGDNGASDQIVFKVPLAEIPVGEAIININQELSFTDLNSGLIVIGTLNDENGIDQGKNIILDANGLYRIFNINNNKQNELHNIELRNGNAELSADKAGWGGSIVVWKNSALSMNQIKINNSVAGNMGSSLGGAIYVEGKTGMYNPSSISITNSEFSDNKAYRGGVIYLDGANIGDPGASIYSENNNYYNNFAGGNGGAINTENSVTIDINNDHFNSNIANNSGGAVYGNGTDSVDIYDSLFENNQANWEGGALHIISSDFQDPNTPEGSYLISNTDFIDNSSKRDGGAIFFDGKSLKLIGNAINKNKFLNNMIYNSLNPTYNSEGGAINIVNHSYLFDEPTNLDITNYIFENNRSGIDENDNIVNAGAGGGAIKFSGGDVNMTNTEFIANQAAHTGGAIDFTRYENGPITTGRLNLVDSVFDSNSTYHNTGAMNFTAVDLNINNTIFENNKAISLNHDTLFADFLDPINNYIGSAGAIGSSGMNGGLFNPNINIENSTFRNNESEIVGGALAATQIRGMSIGNTHFENNKSPVGGAIAISVFDEGFVINESNFEGNEASLGGAVATFYLQGQISKSSFYKNKLIAPTVADISNFITAYGVDVSAGGGAVFLGGPASLLNNSFIENEAMNKTGGAAFFQGFTVPMVYPGQGLVLFNTFYKNSAEKSGGISLKNADISIINNNIFSKNTATEDSNCSLNPLNSNQSNFNIFDDNSICALGADDVVNKPAILMPTAFDNSTKTYYNTISQQSPAYNKTNNFNETMDLVETALSQIMVEPMLSFVVGHVTSFVVTDQIGRAKPLEGGIDAGAIERDSNIDPDYDVPNLTEVTAIPAQTENSSPSYVYNTDVAGTIYISGSCATPVPSPLTANIGNNTINFGPLPLGVYNNCKFYLMSADDMTSNTLNIPTFEIIPPINPPNQNGGGNGGGVGAGGPYGHPATEGGVVIPSQSGNGGSSESRDEQENNDGQGGGQDETSGNIDEEGDSSSGVSENKNDNNQPPSDIGGSPESVEELLDKPVSNKPNSDRGAVYIPSATNNIDDYSSGVDEFEDGSSQGFQIVGGLEDDGDASLEDASNQDQSYQSGNADFEIFTNKENLSGQSSSSWLNILKNYWWIIILIITITVGYYKYRKYQQKNKKGRK